MPPDSIVPALSAEISALNLSDDLFSITFCSPQTKPPNIAGKMTDLCRKALIFFLHSSLIAYQATSLIYLWVVESLKFALPHVIGSISQRA